MVKTFWSVLFWKNAENGRFSGRLWPDWGNTARAAMAGLGVYRVKHYQLSKF